MSVDELFSVLFAGWSGEPFAIRLWDGSQWSSAPQAEPRFTVIARDPAVVPDLASSDLEVLGEAYVSGAIDVEGDMLACFPLLEFLATRRPVPAPSARSEPAGRQFVATDTAHSLARAREAVNFHYELPSELFALFLDAQRVYSCAYFRDPDETIDAAQTNKLEHVCRKLRLRPGDELLDLGCGWGGLVVHAAQHHGVRATGITLSTLQADIARRRIRDAGLQDRCTIEVLDFRELDGHARFDKIASIGAVEHVARVLLPQYYERCWQLLRPGGLMLNHGVSSRPSRPLGAGNAFHRKYIFPDHELVPVSVMLAAAEEVGFEVRDVESLREHYALTLAAWYRRLQAHAREAIALASETTVRAFLGYLAGTSHYFRTGDLDIHQSLLDKPNGGSSVLPLTRDDLYR